MRPKKSQTIVYLVRHGAYENPEGILPLRLPGFPLSTDGKKQAQKLADWLASKPIEAVYTSPILRTSQTAQVIASSRKLPIYMDDRLMDLLSPLQGKPLSYINSLNSDFYRKEFIQAGAERLEDVFARMNEAISDASARNREKRIVVVSHGDAIMSIAVRYAGKSLPGSFPYDEVYVKPATGFELRMDAIGTAACVSKINP